MSIINNANENYFRHCSQNSLSNSFLYLKHMVENIFSLELSILSAFCDIAFCIQIFFFSRSVNVYSSFFQNILQTISPKNFFFLIWYILAKIQIKLSKKKVKEEKVFYFYAFKVTTIKVNASEKAYNCHQKKILLAYICVKLKKLLNL